MRSAVYIDTNLSLFLSLFSGCVQCGDHELYPGAHVCRCVPADRSVRALGSGAAGASAVPRPPAPAPTHPPGSELQLPHGAQ